MQVVDMALKALESDSILAVRIAAVRAAASHVGLCSREHVDQHAVHLGKDLSHMMSQVVRNFYSFPLEHLGIGGIKRATYSVFRRTRRRNALLWNRLGKSFMSAKKR